MLNSLRLSHRLRKDRKRNERVTAIREARIEEAHAFMMKLSAAGYTVVKNPTL